MIVDLRNKVLVITGASSGIGAATALEAGRAGIRVVLAARRREMLDEVAARVGSSALVVPTDVGDPQQVRALVERTVSQFGRIDAMFANAGFGHFHRVLDEGHDEAERQMWRVNYFGAVECVRAAARQMVRQGGGGHVLLCSSIVAMSGLAYYASYAATKGAQHALACSLRGELAEHGIHVTAVYPVGTETDFSGAVRRVSGRDALESNTPAALRQTADHVARRVVACLRRPRPEVWPSRLGHLGAAVWTLFPRLRERSFRQHVQGSRKLLDG